MLASMKTPDWSQAPPGFIGRHNSVPCTVTTSSTSSSLKMYPYSVYSSSSTADLNRCVKQRTTNCIRHRCPSGSTMPVVLPPSSSRRDATAAPVMGLPNALLQRCHQLQLDAAGRAAAVAAAANCGLMHSVPLSNFIAQSAPFHKLNLVPTSYGRSLGSSGDHHHQQLHSTQQPLAPAVNHEQQQQHLFPGLNFHSFSSTQPYQHRSTVFNSEPLPRGHAHLS